ncbi:MAG: OmpA family protein [Pseudomonadota bacterium]
MELVSAFVLMFAVLVFSEPRVEDRIILIPDAEGNVGELIISNQTGAQSINQAYQLVEVDGESHLNAPKQLSKEVVQQDFSDALTAIPQAPSRYILYFVSGTTHLTDESQQLIEKIIADVKSREFFDVFIDGHTDTLGATEVNYRLALKRAQMVNVFFGNKIAKPEKVQVTSHGEGNLLIKTADEVDEPRNRRVEIVIH